MTQLFIDEYEVLLLDMGNTFMFGCDRFADSESVVATYARLGGTAMSDEELAPAIVHLERQARKVGNDSAYFDNFPALIDILRRTPAGTEADEKELARLVQVFALHERGTIESQYADALHELHRTHPLGLVSNILSPSGPFRESLRQAGVEDLFKVIVFSSDIGCIKPSVKPFEQALSAFDSPRDRVLYIGDTYKRDVVGAKSAGLDCVWISRGREEPQGFEHKCDLIVTDLRELLDCSAREADRIKDE